MSFHLGDIVEIDTGERLRLGYHTDNAPECPQPWEIVYSVDPDYHWDTRPGAYVRAHSPVRVTTP
jgi:hypothetical protein